MNSKKIFLFSIWVAIAAGLMYLLLLGHLYLFAQDDHAFIAAYHNYGINSSFLYWYNHFQGRFTAHYLLNVVFYFTDHHVPLVIYYVAVLGIYAIGVNTLLKNSLAYFGILLDEGEWLLPCISSFTVIISVYSNFEFNTFYWLNASVMYFGGVAFFFFGAGQILNNRQGPLSFVLVAASFLYVGASSESFSFVSMVLCSILLLSTIWRNKHLSFRDLAKNAMVQKTILAIIIAGIAFLIMASAPGNKVRMAAINTLYNGYKKVPLTMHELPGEVFYNYKILLALILGKLPLIICALPVFIAAGALAKHVMNRAVLFKAGVAGLMFCLLLSVFITPTVYATACLGPLRSLTFLSCFLYFLVCYVGFAIGNVYSAYRRVLTIVGILALVLWTGIFLKDINRQIPEMSKYNVSEKNRLNYLAAAKEHHVTGVVMVDSLYKPRFKSYTNVFRNQLMDILKKHNLVESTYYPIEFEPLFYDEISADTSYYLNTDLENDLKLPFAVQLKR